MSLSLEDLLMAWRRSPTATRFGVLSIDGAPATNRAGTWLVFLTMPRCPNEPYASYETKASLLRDVAARELRDFEPGIEIQVHVLPVRQSACEGILRL